MTVRTEVLLAFLASVDLMSLGALVKISTKLTALKQARQEMEALRAKAHNRAMAVQWPTSDDIDRCSVTLGGADRSRLMAQHRDAVQKVASPYDVFRLFFRSAGRRRRRLAVTQLVIAVAIAEVNWIIWRQLSS